MAYINSHNSRDISYRLAPNQWTDLTFDEFISTRRGLPTFRTGIGAPAPEFADVKLPVAIDWRIAGAVNPIKNQQQCGDCWAFSAIAAVEGAYAISTKKAGKTILLDLSEQQLTDCSGAQGNLGCNGGLMTNAFTYAKDHALCTEKSYPFAGVDGSCKTCAGLVKVGGFVNIPSGNETALAAAVSLGVVSVAIEADTTAFQFYSSGVFKNSGCGTNLDHGVALVGYGADATAGKYWILRNSWSSAWGEAGYMKLARGVNECGVALSASYPTGVAASKGLP